MKKYIHYGHKKFDINKFNPIRNISCFVKPNGGLWASSIDSEWGWKDWCESERFRECNKDNSFTFTLKEDAKVLRIETVDDLKDLPKMKIKYPIRSTILLDFEKLKEKYDAIEVLISNTSFSVLDDKSLYNALYGWDCDSILIMNPNIIIEIEEEN